MNASGRSGGTTHENQNEPGGPRQAVYAERAKITVSRPELSPDAAELLDRRLRELQSGETVTAVWYTENGRKTAVDTVVAVDLRMRQLILCSHTISFDDLYTLD